MPAADLPPGLAEELAALIEAAERDPAALGEHRDRGAALAVRVGGELAFRWGALDLRALLDDPEALPKDDGIAERYGALVDAARGDEGRLAAVRRLGEQIRELQNRDALPRTMLARLPRHRGR